MQTKAASMEISKEDLKKRPKTDLPFSCPLLGSGIPET
jgi:hypothetical protein